MRCALDGSNEAQRPARGLSVLITLRKQRPALFVGRHDHCVKPDSAARRSKRGVRQLVSDRIGQLGPAPLRRPRLRTNGYTTRLKVSMLRLEVACHGCGPTGQHNESRARTWRATSEQRANHSTSLLSSSTTSRHDLHHLVSRDRERQVHDLEKCTVDPGQLLSVAYCALCCAVQRPTS